MLFNFFDQIGLEHIKYGKPGHHSDFQLTRWFVVWLRIFDLLLLYGLYYVFYKSTQFILSLLFGVDVEDIRLIYYALPVLFFAEVGLSKLNSANPLNFLLYVARALLKFGIIYSLDQIILSLF